METFMAQTNAPETPADGVGTGPASSSAAKSAAAIMPALTPIRESYKRKLNMPSSHAGGAFGGGAFSPTKGSQLLMMGTPPKTPRSIMMMTRDHDGQMLSTPSTAAATGGDGEGKCRAAVNLVQLFSPVKSTTKMRRRRHGGHDDDGDGDGDFDDRLGGDHGHGHDGDDDILPHFLQNVNVMEDSSSKKRMRPPASSHQTPAPTLLGVRPSVTTRSLSPAPSMRRAFSPAPSLRSRISPAPSMRAFSPAPSLRTAFSHAKDGSSSSLSPVPVGGTKDASTWRIKVGTSMKNGLPMCIDCSMGVPSLTKGCEKCKRRDGGAIRDRRAARGGMVSGGIMSSGERGMSVAGMSDGMSSVAPSAAAPSAAASAHGNVSGNAPNYHAEVTPSRDNGIPFVSPTFEMEEDEHVVSPSNFAVTNHKMGEEDAFVWDQIELDQAQEWEKELFDGSDHRGGEGQGEGELKGEEWQGQEDQKVEAKRMEDNDLRVTGATDRTVAISMIAAVAPSIATITFSSKDNVNQQKLANEKTRQEYVIPKKKKKKKEKDIQFESSGANQTMGIADSEVVKKRKSSSLEDEMAFESSIVASQQQEDAEVNTEAVKKKKRRKKSSPTLEEMSSEPSLATSQQHQEDTSVARAATTEVVVTKKKKRKSSALKYLPKAQRTTEKSFILYNPKDEKHINPMHNLVRRHIWEGFVVGTSTANSGDGSNSAHDNYDINDKTGRQHRYSGTIGFRCRYCKHAPVAERADKSAVYPRTIEKIYLSNIRFQRDHIAQCTYIPQKLEEEYSNLKNNMSRGKKQYWVTSALARGLCNGKDGIVFSKGFKK